MTSLPRRGGAPLYQTVHTLLIDDDDRSVQIAWIEGAIWPATGSVVQLHDPNRDAKVVGTLLALAPDGDAVISVYLKVGEPFDVDARVDVRADVASNGGRD